MRRLAALALLLTPLQALGAGFPLRLTLPPDFRDVSGLRENASVYCTAADAQLQRAQLLGQRVYEKMEKGCFVVELDASATYDAASGRFSVEKEIATQGNMRSTSPKFELKTFGVSRRPVQELPALRFTQEATSDYGLERFQFLYLAAPPGVWLVRFIEGKDAKRAAAIWGAFVKGL